MATRYVTLKDSNGDTIYPQSVIAQVANGEITTSLIADGAVTSAKIADGAIATADIANNAVAEAKMDWSTFTTSTGPGSLNTTYITSGSCRWFQIGNLVIVNIVDWNLASTMPNNSTTYAVSGLPAPYSYFSGPHYLVGSDGTTKTIRLTLGTDGKLYFFWPSGAAGATNMCGQIIYFTR